MSIDLDELTPVHRTAFAYWRSLGGSEQRPLRRNFDPFAIAGILGDVIFVNVVDEARDFEIRVVGQTVLDRMHTNFMGKLLSELPYQENRKNAWESFVAVAESGMPRLGAVDYFGPYRQIEQVDVLYLPFFDDSGAVVSILVPVVFEGRGIPPT